MKIVGQILGGNFGEILIRQKHGETVELGTLLATESPEELRIYQAYDLMYGSQIPHETLEMMSGMSLEGYGGNMDFMDPKLRNYVLAKLKCLTIIRKDGVKVPKSLPSFFSQVRAVDEKDLSFITTPQRPLYLGKLRSGSQVLGTDISLEGDKVFSHHILIPATTGRGKSNLVKVLSWDALDRDYCGMLILDPHDEYYGRNEICLKDHPRARDKLSYYTARNPPAGSMTLKINISKLKPGHFGGVINFSDPQKDALYAYYNEFGEEWVREALIGSGPRLVKFMAETLSVVKRKLSQLLDIQIDDETGDLVCRGIFDDQAGQTTLDDICSDLERGKTVIVDTSMFVGGLELLIGSMVTSTMFGKYKHYKMTGDLETKPVITVVLEEAPRVIGKEVLRSGGNIFSTIAREGRKFKVGLTAITQLPSLIPKEILANMNTKIILGIEMGPERQSIMESASQDLSSDDRNIASLDKGEAIVTSNFTKFAVPIKIPFFTEFIKGRTAVPTKKDFSGMN